MNQNNGRVGNLLIRNDPLELDEDFSKYVLVHSANLGSNDSDPPLFAIRFYELPFAIRIDGQLAAQLRDGLNLLLGEQEPATSDDITPEPDGGNIAGPSNNGEEHE